MTPKPSEAEIAQLELLVAKAPGEWAYVHGYGFNRHTSMDGPPTAHTRLAVAACNALPGLLARIRELEAAYGEALGVAERGLERAEAAGKRVEELLDARIADTAAITKAWGKLRAAEAELAAIRDALEAAVDFIATGDFTDDARRQAIAKAETALAGAEAGERRVFEGWVNEGESCLLNEFGVVASEDFLWLEGLEGQRVRLTVEVLPEPKEAP